MCMQKRFIIFVAIISFPLLSVAESRESKSIALANDGSAVQEQDTSLFAVDTARYDADDKLTGFVGSDGLSIRYPAAWERDYRSSEDVMLYLRPYDNNAPYVFREQITITSEGLLNDAQSIADYATMILNITEDTWQKYNVEVIVEAGEAFELNGMPGYRAITKLPRLSQVHLIVFFKYNAKAYTVEFIASDVTYDASVEMAWKFINALGFVEK